MLNEYQAPKKAEHLGSALPSPGVVDRFRNGIAQHGPFSADDNWVLIKVLHRLGEIEGEEGMQAALKIADLVCETFQYDVEND